LFCLSIGDFLVTVFTLLFIARGNPRVLPSDKIVLEPCNGAAVVSQRNWLWELSSLYQFGDLSSPQADELRQIAQAIHAIQTMGFRHVHSPITPSGVCWSEEYRSKRKIRRPFLNAGI
jgi:hypothetical protein